MLTRSCHSKSVADFAWDSFGYRVRSAALVTPAIRELWLEPVREALPFCAGQYLLLSDADHRVPQRSYSLANAPRADGLISLLVTIVPGGPTSTWAHRLAPGDDVAVEGPYGTFVASADARSPVLLLGAGSGLAPLRAIAEELTARDTGRSVTLFFSGRTTADIIDRARFEHWAESRPGFDYRITCTRDAREKRHARLPELLAAEFETLSGTSVFTSGAPGFVTGCHRAAVALGADPADIRTEEFFVDGESTVAPSGNRLAGIRPPF